MRKMLSCRVEAHSTIVNANIIFWLPDIALRDVILTHLELNCLGFAVVVYTTAMFDVSGSMLALDQMFA